MKFNSSLLTIILMLVAPFSISAFNEPSSNRINIAFGAGFDDATVVAAVGGNNYTTLGEQRKEVIRRAVLIWSQELDLKFNVDVTVDFSDSFCSAYSANLGSAGPENMYKTGDIWYPSALGNQISLSDTSQDGLVTWEENDIHIDINALIETGCFNGATNGWYYGLDNPVVPDEEANEHVDLLSVVVHELAHGLGFLSLTNSSSGAWFYSYPDSYSQYLYDNGTNKAWTSMSDAERAASGISGNLAWNGASTNTYAATVLTDGITNDRVEMFSPNPLQQGSSISHFSTDATPNQVMEPLATDAYAVDIEAQLMKDIGWTLTSDVAQPVITMKNPTINVDENGSVVLEPLHEDASEASVGDVYMYEYSQLPTNGSLSDVYSDTPTYTPAANFTGTDEVKYYVYDQDFNLSAEGTLNIVVGAPPAVDAAPVSADDSYTFDEDSGQQTLDVLDNDSDDNSLDATSITITSTLDEAVISISGGNVLLTPNSNVSGNYSFTYTVDDDAGNTSNESSVSLTITAVNDAPVAVTDSFSVSEDHAGATLDLISNDTDVDSTLSNADVTIVDQPDHGVISIVGSTLSYAPSLHYNGSDSFTYFVSDTDLDSNTVSVSINVTAVNDAPVSIQDGFTFDQNTSFDLYILTNDTDADHSVDYSMVNIASDVSHGTLELTASMLTYTPDNDYFGSDSFTYYLDDSTDSGNTVIVELTVTHVNSTPTANDDSFSIDEDTQSVFDVTINDYDDVSIASISVTTEPTHGTLVINNDNTVTYTPDENYSGSDSFAYKVTDNESAQSDTASVAITINSVNDAPIANDDSFTITNGSINIFPLLNDTDEDMNTISITIDTQPSNGAVSVSGSNVVYLADANFVGLDSFTYHLTDNDSVDSDIATVNVSISSDVAPLTNHLNISVDEDSINNSLDLLTGNVFVNAITEIIITSGPTHGDLTVSNTTVTYTPDENYAGGDTFSYQIKDSSNLTSNESSVNLTVNEINDAPVAVNDTASVTINNSKSINVLNNDWDESLGSVSIEIVAQANLGSVSIENNQIVYVANNQFSATTDQFSYRIIDSESVASNTAFVDMNISLQADLPVAYNDQYSMIKNEVITFNPTLDDDFYTNNISLSVSNFDNGTASTDGLNVTVTPVAGFVGDLSITYVITDDLSQISNEATIMISVIDDDIASMAHSVYALIDTDIQFDALSVNASITDAQITISQFPSKGDVSVVNDDILYQPYASMSGQDQFAYILTQSNQSQIQVSVEVDLLTQSEFDIRTAQVSISAVDDAFTVIEDSQLSLAVLFNDLLNDDSTYQINIVQSSMNGQITVNNDSVTYQPNANFYGADGFTYEVIDTQTNETTNTASVVLDVTSVNDVPSSTDFNLELTNSITFDLFSNAVDVDGTMVGINILSAPSHGLLILSGNQATYSAVNGYSGLDQFTYTISDNQGGVSAVITVDISVSAPVVVTVTPDTTHSANDSNDEETVNVQVSSGSFNLIELSILLLSLLSILIIRQRQTARC